MPPGAITLDARHHTLHSPFGIGDLVYIDGCKSIEARVIEILFSSAGLSLRVAYFVNGELREPWVHAWRLEYVS